MKFLIWSHEHRQWWAPNRQGYTTDVQKAGRYSYEDAADITVGVIPPGIEVAVPEQVAVNHGPSVVYGYHIR